MVGERLEVGGTVHHTAIGGGTRRQMSIVVFRAFRWVGYSGGWGSVAENPSIRC